MRPILFIALLFASSTAFAQVFKCSVDGRTVFSDRPCSADSAPIDLRPAMGQYDRDAAREAETRTSRERARVSEIETERRVSQNRVQAEIEAKRQAELDRCAKIGKDKADAETRAARFHHPDQIKREREKAKHLATRQFFDC